MKLKSEIKSLLSILPLIALLMAGPAFAQDGESEKPAAAAPPDKSEEPAAAEGEKSQEPADGEKKEEENADVEIVITGNDQMRYDKQAFKVKTGQRVKLTLKNIGMLAKFAMGHNLVILKKGVNKMTFAVEALTAGPQTDYLPTKKDDILAHTKLLGPKEEESIFFTAPEPGKYDYICTFPGHVALMNGVMTVVP